MRFRDFLIKDNLSTDGIHYHDWAIYAASRCWNSSWVFDQQPTLRYRQHDGNDTGARLSFDGMLRRLLMIRNGWYAGQLRAVARLCATAAPDNRMLTEWQALLARPAGPLRWSRVLWRCSAGGRRRRLDRGILIAAALVGWI
jgi:rhamnosyltransferase